MFAEERYSIIMQMLNERSSIKVSEIAAILNISESTVRRDLQEMEDMHLLMRTHGGAVTVKNRTNFEPSFLDKKDEMMEQKISIAEAASNMIEDGDTIILDSGTTTLEIAKRIKAKNITVLTNSIDIAAELFQKDSIETIVTGGKLRSNTRAMVGHIAESVFRDFRVDKVFIGANGISIEDGVTTPNDVEAQTKRTMVKYANKVIVVADSSKFENVCFSIICSLKDVNTIVTSRDLPEELVNKYSNLGIRIITA